MAITYGNELYSVVFGEVIENDLNVFFSEGAINLYKKRDVSFYYFASDNYIVPLIISTKGPFVYAHFCSEPAIIKQGSSCKLFLDEVCATLKNTFHVQWVNQTPASAFFEDYPTGSKFIPFGSHVIDLSHSEDELWQNVHSKHRNVIKKAEKDGVEIRYGLSEELIEDYNSIDILTWSRSNKRAISIDRLKKTILPLGSNAIVYMAYLDNIPQSGAIFYYNRQMCYYMYGANKDNPHTGSGNLLQWKAILDMKSRGVLKYSFVGCRINEDEDSKYHGIQRFKERFGGSLIQGYMFKIDFSPLMRKMFDMLVSLRSVITEHRFISNKDVIDQEIHKWNKQ